MHCVLPQFIQTRNQIDRIRVLFVELMPALDPSGFTDLAALKKSKRGGWRQGEASEGTRSGEHAPCRASGRGVAMPRCSAPCPPLSLTSLPPLWPHRSPQEPAPAGVTPCAVRAAHRPSVPWPSHSRARSAHRHALDLAPCHSHIVAAPPPPLRREHVAPGALLRPDHHGPVLAVKYPTSRPNSPHPAPLPPPLSTPQCTARRAEPLPRSSSCP